MKTPTKKQLQELAVRALGEGARVRVLPCTDHGRGAWYAEASPSDLDVIDGVDIWHRKRDAAKYALAAALAALAEVRK